MTFQKAELGGEPAGPVKVSARDQAVPRNAGRSHGRYGDCADQEGEERLGDGWELHVVDGELLFGDW